MLPDPFLARRENPCGLGCVRPGTDIEIGVRGSNAELLIMNAMKRIVVVLTSVHSRDGTDAL
jgi:hypothetical protein